MSGGQLTFGGGGGGGGGGIGVDQDGSSIVATATVVNFIGLVPGAVSDPGGGQVDVGPFDYLVTFDQDVFPGTPCYIEQGVPVGGGAAAVAFAGGSQANAAVVGFSLQAASAGSTGYIRVGGVLTLTALQWAVVTGDPAGFPDVGFPYYLSDTGAGELVFPAPTTSGSWSTAVGIPLFPTMLLIRPETPVAIP